MDAFARGATNSGRDGVQPTATMSDLEAKFTIEADLDYVGYRVHQRMTPHELRIMGFVVQGLRKREIVKSQRA